MISPNGDGFAERQRELTYKVVRPSNVTATLVAPGGAVVFTETLLRQPGTYPVAFPPAAADPTAASPLRRPRAAGGSTSRPPTISPGPRRRRRTFTVNNTLGFAKLSRRSLVVRVRGKQTISAGVTLTRAARVTATVETKTGVQVATIAVRRLPAGRFAASWRGTTRGGKFLVYGGMYVVRFRATNELGAVEVVSARVPRHPRGAGAAEEARRARGLEPPRVPVASILSEVTDLLTTVVGDYGLYAVFILMLIDAVFPAASEPVMVYGGAVAAGAFAGQDIMLFGWTIESGLPAFLAVALAGTIGYTLGSIGGWWLGLHGGRPFLERHGRWLHLNEAKLDQAERWFERWEDWAVFLGRLTPVVRSFVSIPAGIFEAPFRRYVVLTLLGSAIWCFALAGVGWALGSQWEDFHHAFRYVDYAIARAARGRGRVAGVEVRPQARKARAGAPLDSSGREDRSRRRQGAVRAADPRVPGGVRACRRVRQVRLRARGPGLRGRGRRVPRRPACDRRRQRHRRARARARGDGHRQPATR